MVERSTHNPKIEGSNPATCNKMRNSVISEKIDYLNVYATVVIVAEKGVGHSGYHCFNQGIFSCVYELKLSLCVHQGPLI